MAECQKCASADISLCSRGSECLDSAELKPILGGAGDCVSLVVSKGLSGFQVS